MRNQLVETFEEQQGQKKLTKSTKPQEQPRQFQSREFDKNEASEFGKQNISEKIYQTNSNDESSMG